MRRESLHRACESIAADVDEMSACVLLDLETGLPLVMHGDTARVSADAMEALAHAGASCFNECGSADGANHATHDVEEVQITTDDSYFFMSRVPGHANEILIVVIERAKTTLGLGWESMHQALAEIRDAGLYEDDMTPAARRPDADRSRVDPGAVFNQRSGNVRRSIWD